jgi:hypothetical protein
MTTNEKDLLKQSLKKLIDMDNPIEDIEKVLVLIDIIIKEIDIKIQAVNDIK